MSKRGGRINPNGPLNEEKGSVLENLNKLDPEVRARYYRNKKEYYERTQALQDWADQGFQVAEQYQGTEWEEVDLDGESSGE